MEDILKEISDIVGPSGMISGDDVKKRPNDWLSKTSCNAKAIIRPKTTEDISAILKKCHAVGQSVIAAGGLTGLVHATEAEPDDLILSLERMNTIETIDPVGRAVTVQAGTPLQKVQEFAQDHDLLFAVDLGARGSATIGGNIATNAGGNQVLRYGMMREQVLGLEVVLADGAIVSSMNRLLKNNAGYDLKQLFIGAEGTLGIVTRAVLRLHPSPKSESTALIAVANFDTLVDLFKYVGAKLGGSLTAFEVMWRDYYQIVAVDSGQHTPPIAPGAAFYVIVESTGTEPDQDPDHFMNVLSGALEAELVEDATIAASKAQRDAIWNIREDIESVSQAIMPAAIFDVSLPITEMNGYITTLQKAVRDRWGAATKPIIFGHLGDGNLHIGIAPRPWSEEARHEAEQMVYSPLSAIGGSISAEHGIGLEKRSWLHISRSQEELNLMRLLKNSLDPKNILNPGKILNG